MGAGLDLNPYRLRTPERRRGCAGPTAVDLFSGAGGIALGLINSGFNVVYCADIDAACEATHRRNFPHVPFIRSDIEKIKGADILRASGLRRGELDLLIGGPPC